MKDPLGVSSELVEDREPANAKKPIQLIQGESCGSNLVLRVKAFSTEASGLLLLPRTAGEPCIEIDRRPNAYQS